MCGVMKKLSGTSAGNCAAFPVWLSGVLRWLRGTGGIQCFLAWLCVAFSAYWIAARLKDLLVLLKVDACYVLWGGIAGGFVLQVVCYVCFRWGARTVAAAPFLFPGRGMSGLENIVACVSLFIRWMCGLLLLLWPLTVLTETFLLAREVAVSSGRLLGILKECMIVWSLPVWVLVVLGGNYLLFDHWRTRALKK